MTLSEALAFMPDFNCFLFFFLDFYQHSESVLSSSSSEEERDDDEDDDEVISDSHESSLDSFLLWSQLISFFELFSH